MPTIVHEGEAFNVRIDGPDGAPVLLLSNSLSSDLSMWEDQIPAWSQRFRVVRYDQRGHGKSTVSPTPYSIAQLGRDSIGIMDALGIAKTHWCGLSLGGMVGMWVLTHARERIDKAVLANTASHMGPPNLWNERIRTAERGGMSALVGPTIDRWFPEHFRKKAPDTIERMRAMILRTPVIGYQGCCSAIRDMDQRETIKDIVNPVLVVIGSRDPATSPADGELIANAIRGAETARLDAAHISNVEQPSAFTEIVTKYLS